MQCSKNCAGKIHSVKGINSVDESFQRLNKNVKCFNKMKMLDCFKSIVFKCAYIKKTIAFSYQSLKKIIIVKYLILERNLNKWN